MSRWMVAVCLMLLHVAASAAVKVPAYERVQLPNGTVLLLMEQRELPLIEFSAVLRSGGIADPEQRSGTANLLAGLLEKGAGARDAATFASDVAAVGGTISTGAQLESITISGSFLSRDRELMVSLLSDMLMRPRLDEQEFVKLRDRQIEFIRASKEAELASLTGLYARAALLPDHPYGRPVSGSEASLARISVTDVRRYYEQQVGADRLILSIAGDFDARSMRRTLEQAFGKWRKAAGALPQVPAPSRTAGRRVLLVDAPDSVQSYFWIGNLGVARADERRAAIDIANTLFGGRFTSMLNSELRVRTGLTYGARSSFLRLQQPGPFAITSFTQAKTTIDAIDLALDVLQRLHAQPPEAAMLASARQYVQGQFPLGLETSSQWAATLADLELYGLPRSYIENYATDLNGVTGGRLKQTVATAFPRTDDVLIVVIGPAAQIRDSLRKYGAVIEMQISAPDFAPTTVSTAKH